DARAGVRRPPSAEAPIFGTLAPRNVVNGNWHDYCVIPSTYFTRTCNEAHYRDHQTLQAGRSPRSLIGDRHTRLDGNGGKRVRAAEGTYRALSGRRVHGGFSPKAAP